MKYLFILLLLVLALVLFVRFKGGQTPSYPIPVQTHLPEAPTYPAPLPGHDKD